MDTGKQIAASGKLNRALAIVLSGMAAIGIHAHYSAADHTLLLTGLSVGTIVNGAWHWLVQSLYAHGWYKATSVAAK
jgi:hypothetical protein